MAHPPQRVFPESSINHKVRSFDQDTKNDEKFTLWCPLADGAPPAQNIRGCLERNACFAELEGPGRPSMAQEAPGGAREPWGLGRSVIYEGTRKRACICLCIRTRHFLLQSHVFYACSYILGLSWGTNPWCFTYVLIDFPSHLAPTFL